MYLACVAHGSARGVPGSPGENEPIALNTPTPAVCVATATANLTPLDESGKNTTITSKLAFDKNAGALSCAGGEFKGKISGKLKFMAYQQSEVISTKTP